MAIIKQRKLKYPKDRVKFAGVILTDGEGKPFIFKATILKRRAYRKLYKRMCKYYYINIRKLNN